MTNLTCKIAPKIAQIVLIAGHLGLSWETRNLAGLKEGFTRIILIPMLLWLPCSLARLLNIRNFRLVITFLFLVRFTDLIIHWIELSHLSKLKPFLACVILLPGPRLLMSPLITFSVSKIKELYFRRLKK